MIYYPAVTPGSPCRAFPPTARDVHGSHLRSKDEAEGLVKALEEGRIDLERAQPRADGADPRVVAADGRFAAIFIQPRAGCRT